MFTCRFPFGRSSPCSPRLTGSSVAPAQVNSEAAEPLVRTGMDSASGEVIAIDDESPSTGAARPAGAGARRPKSKSSRGSAGKPTGDSCRAWSPSCAAPMPAAASSSASPSGSISKPRANRSPASSPSAMSSPIAPTCGRFPSSYCGVLFQRSQFSFVRGRSYPSIPRSSRQWQTAVAIAKIVDQQLHESPVPKALFFHATRVQPRWRLTARRKRRQPRLLPLDFSRGQLPWRPRSLVSRFVLIEADGFRSDSRLLPRPAADRGRGRARGDAALLPPRLFAMCEVPLPNGRRADMMAIDPKGS